MLFNRKITNIKLTRGDSLAFKTRVIFRNGSIADKKDIESFFVTFKKGTNNISPIIFQKTIDDINFDDDGYLHCLFNPEDTENLDYGIYYFDIEVTSNNIRKTKLIQVILTPETTIHGGDKNGI